MKTSIPREKFVKPPGANPIVNDSHFSDSHAVTDGAPPTPGLGSPQDTFNPAQGAGALPNGPPRYIAPKGPRVQQPGLSNKRIGKGESQL